MTDYEEIEKKTEKKFSQKDERKKPKMHMSGKSVFTLRKLITKLNDSSSKRKNRKKNK